jgi:hypothetical protein
LKYYAVAGAIYAAAQKVGLERNTVTRWAKKDKKFRAAMDEAVEQNTELLLTTAVSRATQGTSKGADTLLMFLLKGRQPEVWRERYEFTGDARPFTVRDFLLLGKERAAKLGRVAGAEQSGPGVVSGQDPGDKGMGKTA